MIIWKWKLAKTKCQKISMPENSIILSVQTQSNEICMWTLCDKTANKVERVIMIYMNGFEIPDNPGKFIATVQIENIDNHIFDLGVLS